MPRWHPGECFDLAKALWRTRPTPSLMKITSNKRSYEQPHPSRRKKVGTRNFEHQNDVATRERCVVRVT
jgi:hypothetical protein